MHCTRYVILHKKKCTEDTLGILHKEIPYTVLYVSLHKEISRAMYYELLLVSLTVQYVILQKETQHCVCVFKGKLADGDFVIQLVNVRTRCVLQ